MTVTQSQEPENLEAYSIETPAPPEFLPYESGGAAVSYDNDATQVPEGNSDEFVRHGRSPRFWMLIIGAIVVVAAVGGGVGVAMSSGGGSALNANSEEPSWNVPSSSSDHSNNAATVEEELVQEVFEGLQNGSKENKETNQVGAVVNMGSNGAGSGSAAPTSEIFDIILTHARFHGVEFQDPNSYQSKAAKWVEQTAQLGVHTPQRLLQRYALACIYYATNGVENAYTQEIFGQGITRKWIDETGWMSSANECEWYRITCDVNGWVTKIELYSNRLTGSFPPEVALLDESLETIDLYQNFLNNQGDSGNSFLGELKNLKELFIGLTYFEYDGIPSYIGSLTKLEEFDCSYTLYHGPLRGETFRFLSNLEYLHIGGNSYNTTIPSQLASLPKLEYFYAEYADIRGDLNFMLQMPQIVELWIDRNPTMEGTIPTEIGLKSTLQSFSITGCNLGGTLPTELANLRLTQFWAYDNNLGGTIPTEYGRMLNLKRLALENNNLMGTMPQEICLNREPNGLLSKLEADCQDGGTVECACCTCCGPQCSGVTSQGV